MKFPFFIVVPDFEDQAKKERKPKYFAAYNEEEQDAWIRDLANERLQKWTAETTARNCNFIIAIGMLLLILDYEKIINLARGIFLKLFGVS